MKLEGLLNVKTTGGVTITGSSGRVVIVSTSQVVEVTGVVGGVLSKGECRGVSRGLEDGAA